MSAAAIPSNPAPRLIIGTAGHIDHGKSRLVRALTGVDPDRLPEERARGMTIELGFAHTRIDDCDVWFVDVPGHERFIRTMVAGATGVDVALLVVAADDSVMPQTREHAEVLKLLGVERCIVALTKLDLVDDEWAAAVEDEVRALLANLGLDAIDVIHTSAESGRGLDELRAALALQARAAADTHDAYTWFRLPIDRAFTIPGRGTVVTGSALHGSVAAEDELELWPTGRRVRARGLQSHHEHCPTAAGHMRLAVNLASVALDDVQRGCELATPGCLEPTRLMDVRILTLRMPGKSPSRTLRLRLHMATRELRAELHLLTPPESSFVHDVIAQISFADEAVAAWGQRFILRDDAEQRTLGGGVVLRPVARRWTARRPIHSEGLEALGSAKPKIRLAEAIRDAEWRCPRSDALATRAGLPDATTAEKLVRELTNEGRLHAVGPSVVHTDVIERSSAAIITRLEQAAASNPRWPGVAQPEWPGWMPRACPEKLRSALADWMAAERRVIVVNGYVLAPGSTVTISDADRALLDTAIQELRDAAYQPPALTALTCRTPRNSKKLDELLELAVARGQIRHVGAGIWLHNERWDELSRLVCDAIRTRGGLTVGDIRTLLDSSRKYVVPICEALDAAGVTRRIGDRRECGPNAPV